MNWTVGWVWVETITTFHLVLSDLSFVLFFTLNYSNIFEYIFRMWRSSVLCLYLHEPALKNVHFLRVFLSISFRFFGFMICNIFSHNTFSFFSNKFKGICIGHKDLIYNSLDLQHFFNFLIVFLFSSLFQCLQTNL